LAELIVPVGSGLQLIPLLPCAARITRPPQLPFREIEYFFRRFSVGMELQTWELMPDRISRDERQHAERCAELCDQLVRDGGDVDSFQVWQLVDRYVLLRFYYR
jgi:hypothetical protein